MSARPRAAHPHQVKMQGAMNDFLLSSGRLSSRIAAPNADSKSPQASKSESLPEIAPRQIKACAQMQRE